MTSLLKCYKCKKPVNGKTYLFWDKEKARNVRICQTCQMIEKLK